MDSRVGGATYATRRNGRTRTVIEDGITGPHKGHSAKAARANPS
jgi:hypothetical protein